VKVMRTLHAWRQFWALPGGQVSILDAGCGNVFLLRAIGERYPKAMLYGLDLKAPRKPIPGKFTRGSVNDIPYPDKAFDVVISTHTLGHCLHLERAVQELMRVGRSELIIVVPKQRSYYYTVDERIQFFFYRDQLTAAMRLPRHKCAALGGDWFYRGQL
jgi:ubiquinone/menaquinone biosynthesis C-methylase UbiE